MGSENFAEVKRFLDGERSRLARIEFFYPYTDEELRAVLEEGFFIAAKDEKGIAATAAVDSDEIYAENLAETACSKLGCDRAYELSGLMVREDLRGQGLAGALMDVILTSEQTRAIVQGYSLCGVVQIGNVPSMASFFSRGFRLTAVRRDGVPYEFGYLVRRIDETFGAIGDIVCRVEAEDYRSHEAAIARGLVGVATEDGTILYSSVK